MLHRNGPRMQMGKYFCLLGNAFPNDDINVTSQQRFVSRVVVCLLVHVQADAGHFEHHFSHALSICRLVD